MQLFLHSEVMRQTDNLTQHATRSSVTAGHITYICELDVAYKGVIVTGIVKHAQNNTQGKRLELQEFCCHNVSTGNPFTNNSALKTRAELFLKGLPVEML